MRRKIGFRRALFTAGILVAALFTAGACSREPASPGNYRNPDQGFSITFPESWQIKENQMGLDVIGLSPLEGPSDTFQDNVSVASSDMTEPMDADQILDANLPAMIRIITDFKPGERGRKDLGGVTAAWLKYTQRQGQFRISATIYAIPGKERAYLIYCIAETSAEKRFEENFDKIVSSFRVKK